MRVRNVVTPEWCRYMRLAVPNALSIVDEMVPRPTRLRFTIPESALYRPGRDDEEAIAAAVQRHVEAIDRALFDEPPESGDECVHCGETCRLGMRYGLCPSCWIATRAGGL
jgi:hypothetical protein